MLLGSSKIHKIATVVTKVRLLFCWIFSCSEDRRSNSYVRTSHFNLEQKQQQEVKCDGQKTYRKDNCDYFQVYEHLHF